MLSQYKKILPVIFLFSAAGLASCSSKKEQANNNERPGYVIPESIMKGLVIDTVQPHEVTNSLKFNGIVDFNPDKVANIYPLISGNAQGITADLGDYVKAGQVLGVIKSSDVANYNAALVSAEATEKLDASLLAKQQDMAKNGLASQLDVATAKATYEQAVAARVAAQKIQSINGGNSTNGELVLRSPINGFIVQKNVTNGMGIRSDNSNSLFTISDLKEVWVEANVYETNINDVHVGDEAEVSTLTNPDSVYTGKIGNLMNVLDPNSRVMKMRIVLPNPNYSLKPQMFASVTVHNDLKQQALAVPNSALIFDHSQYYVLIFNNKADVQIRPVEILSTNGKLTYLKSGVTEGERVIASQAILIYGALNS